MSAGNLIDLKTYSAMITAEGDGTFSVQLGYSWIDDSGHFNQGIDARRADRLPSLVVAERRVYNWLPGARFLNVGGDKGQYRHYLQTFQDRDAELLRREQIAAGEVSKW